MMPAINGLMLGVSSSLVASIAAKVTVTTAFALIGVWLARRSRAALRHALLAAAFGVLVMLPIVSIVAPPVRIAVPVAAQDRTALTSSAEAISANPPSAPLTGGLPVTPAPPRSRGISPATFLIALWIAGAALSLLPMVIGLLQVSSLRRSGLPWLQGQSVAAGLALDTGIRKRVEVLVHEALRGPMTCGIVHPAIVLSPDAQTWQREDLNRAIVHELEHVRRGDWITLCIARAVCAVYWFHPLVWIAWRQLALEAERSCDDAVLGRSDATAYADQLVGLAQRLSMASKSPLLAMANRADLATRVGAVLDGRQQRGRAGVLPVALACAAAALLVLTMSPLRLVAAPQSAAPTGAKPAFDAVSIKLINPDVQGEHISEHDDPGRLKMIGTMHRFVVRSYGLTDAQLGGEPDWFKSHLYSLEGVTAAPAGTDQMMLMLRAALADRFQLKLREELRDLPVYVLEVAPGGPKFRVLKPGEIPHHDPEPPDVFARAFTSVKELMNTLNHIFGGRLTMDRPVVDRTHLTGRYNMHFRTEMETQVDGLGRRNVQFPNVAHDLQSQLGLRLVSTRVKMSFFVVEQASKPTPN